MYTFGIADSIVYAQKDFWSNQIPSEDNDSLLVLDDDPSSIPNVIPMLTSPPSLTGEPPMASARYGTEQGAQARDTGRSLNEDAHEALQGGNAQVAFVRLGQAMEAAESDDHRRLVFSTAIRFLQEDQPTAVMNTLEAGAAGESLERPWALRALVSAYEAQARLADARQAASTLAVDYAGTEHALSGLASDVELALRQDDESGAAAALSALAEQAPDDPQTEAAQRLYVLATGQMPPAGRSFYTAPMTTEVKASTDSFRLLPAYPNPFNPETLIAFEVAEATTVCITVFDVLGREVTTLANGHYEPGRYTTAFGGSEFASGLYLVQVTAAPETSAIPKTYTQRITLLK